MYYVEIDNTINKVIISEYLRQKNKITFLCVLYFQIYISMYNFIAYTNGFC